MYDKTARNPHPPKPPFPTVIPNPSPIPPQFRYTKETTNAALEVRMVGISIPKK